jgi:hypothetical protein
LYLICWVVRATTLSSKFVGLLDVSMKLPM